MKVVLFCNRTGIIPLNHIGFRPVIWNIMKYYAHFGHKDFILFLGKNGEMIKDFFMNYSVNLPPYIAHDKVNTNYELLKKDLEDWTITFLQDSGNMGMNLMKVKEHLKGDKMFLVNNSDGLTDLNLTAMINWFKEYEDKTAAFMVCRPTQSFHFVERRHDGLVNNISHIKKTGYFVNSGYLIFRQDIYNYIKKEDNNFIETFQRIIKKNKLVCWEHLGFWARMENMTDLQEVAEDYVSGNAPWEVWRNNVRN